jgi:hypothetical protein
VDESNAYLTKRFKKKVGKCLVQLPDAEYASMTMNGMHPHLTLKPAKGKDIYLIICFKISRFNYKMVIKFL